MKKELKYFKEKNGIYIPYKDATSVKGAFEKSIEKWELRSEGENVLAEIESCGLCDLFRDAGCFKCPIALKTRRKYCNDTPFILWQKEQKIEYAKMEVEFLKKLYAEFKKNKGE